MGKTTWDAGSGDVWTYHDGADSWQSQTSGEIVKGVDFRAQNPDAPILKTYRSFISHGGHESSQGNQRSGKHSYDGRSNTGGHAKHVPKSGSHYKKWTDEGTFLSHSGSTEKC